MKTFNVGYEMKNGSYTSTKGVYLIRAEDEAQASDCATKLFAEEEDTCWISNVYETEHREGDVPAIIARNI